MKTLLLVAAVALTLAGCASTRNTAADNEPAEMPEYTTGSSIAQKSRTKPTAVQTASSEALSEIQRNSPIPMR